MSSTVTAIDQPYRRDGIGISFSAAADKSLQDRFDPMTNRWFASCYNT